MQAVYTDRMLAFVLVSFDRWESSCVSGNASKLSLKSAKVTRSLDVLISAMYAKLL